MKKAILIHGYNKNKNDMRVLQANLLTYRISSTLIDLPLTFRPIQDSSIALNKHFTQVVQTIAEDEKISLIGHSSGGLAIRYFISLLTDHSKLDRCVFIATPNQGTKLANMAEKWVKPIYSVFRTLDSLHTEHAVRIPQLHPAIEFGAIAGNKNNLLLGKLLQAENDGRIEISSVNMDGLKDFIVVPYGHKEIHYQTNTARLTSNFIHTGKFNHIEGEL